MQKNSERRFRAADSRSLIVRRLPLLFIAFGFAFGSVISDVIAAPSAPKKEILKAEIGAFGILTDTVQSGVGIKCANKPDGVYISDVHLGSEAINAGLEVGDKITEAHMEGDRVCITIARSGHVYQAKLRNLQEGKVYSSSAGADSLKGQAGQSIFKGSALSGSLPGGQLRGGLDDPSFKLGGMTNHANEPYRTFEMGADQLKFLASHQIVVVVDRSLSMGTRDCPGGYKRFEWCAAQSANLGKKLDRYLPQGETVVTFANDFNVTDNCTGAALEQIYASTQLQLNTRLAEPLEAITSKYLSSWRKGAPPLLIMVITDGVPYPGEEPNMVRDVLVKTTRQMSDPHQIEVVFLQIGSRERFGAKYVKELEANLTSFGAQYPIVHAQLFDRIVDAGLGQSVIESIFQYDPSAISRSTPVRSAAKASTRTAKPTARKTK